MSPASSCAAPSSVEIDSAVACLKVSGSAPYFSWLASSSAVVWVKLPLIVVGLLLIADWMVGAEMTRPSRVKATFLPTLAAVYCAQVCSASFWKSSSTTHSPVACWVPARASETWVPSMIAGPSRYLAEPSWVHAATKLSGRSTSGVVSSGSQVSVAYSAAACSCGTGGAPGWGSEGAATAPSGGGAGAGGGGGAL